MRPSTHMWWFLFLFTATNCVALYEVHRKQQAHLRDAVRTNEAALDSRVDTVAGCRTVYLSPPRPASRTDL